MKCGFEICRFRTEEGDCVGAPAAMEECRLYKPLIEKTDPVAKLQCSDGLACPICGSKMAFIRGRNPGSDNRKVCPTCLQERMEEINNISSRDYNVAYTDGAS